MDQYYYEEGYIDARYHVYVAVAEGLIQPYFENGYLEEYYFLNEGAWATLTFEGDIVNIIVEASGSWSSEFAQSTAAINIKPLSATIASEFQQSTDIIRARSAAANINSEFAQTTSAGKIQQAEAAFTGAFTPTLTADAFKNHTAVIESISAMSIDAVVGRSANVLLEHIANLNAMAIKEAVGSATMASTSSQTTTANKTQQIQADISAATALTSNSGKLKTVSAASSISSTLFVSRYTNGRPRHLSGIDYQYLNEYFTTDSKFGSYALKATAPTTSISASSASAYPLIPAANEDWIFECWYYNGSHQTHDLFNFYVGGGQRFVNLTANDDRTFTLRLFKEGGFTTNTTSSPGETLNNWLHIALVYSNGYAALFVGGQRRILQDLTAYTAVNYTGKTNEYAEVILRLGVRGSAALDEASMHHSTTLGFNPQSTTITVPSSARTNDATLTQFLYHFENNGFDDIALTQTGTANLSAVSTITAQANANTKSVSAAISSTSTVVCATDRIKSSQSAITATTDISTNGGKLLGIIETLISEFSLVDGLKRIRYAESSQNSLFSPSVIVQATKSGEIVLEAAFALTADANSFTEAPAALTSQFAITATADGITRITAVALSSQFQITDNLGRLQTATVNISGAFNATVNVKYFEGTSLIAPMTATITVAAVKTARITKTLSVVATVAATGFEAPADPGPVATLKPYGLWHFDSFTPIYGLPPNNNIIQGYQTYDAYDNSRYMWATQNISQSKFGGSSLDSPTTITAGVVAGTIDVPTIGSGNFTADLWYYWVDPTGTPAGFGRAIGVPNSNGSAVLYEIRTYAMNGGALIINGSTVYTFSLSNWQHLALQRNGTALTLWRDGQLLTSHTVSQDAVGTRWAVDTVRSGNTNYSSRGFVDELRIRPIAGYSTTFTPPTAAYDLEYDILDLKQLYAVIEPRFTIDAQGISLVFIDAALLAGTFAQSTQALRFRQAQSTLSTSSTVYANAGKAAVATAGLSSTATVSSQVSRTRLGTATLTSTATVECSATRVRYNSSQISSEFTQTTAAVKQTGNVISAESTFAQSTVNDRIRYALAGFSAFNSTVTAAIKNATGTVLLESQFQQTTTAEKNAVGVIALASDFTVTTNTAQGKIVGFAVAMSADTAQTTEGDRIQPAGAELSSAFTQSTNTTASKITRITAGLAETVNLSADVERFRDSVSIEAGTFTITCQNDTIRFASAAFTSTFTVLASPTFIVRITANFTAFNSQLTVGDVINLDPYLTITIEPETRSLFILPENRIKTIESETRVNII